MAVYIAMAIIAYLIGSINFSVILSKKMAGFDVREKGSGNAGSTNMLRSVGKKAAAITLICDILKGVVSIGIAILLGNVIENMNRELLVQIAGIAVVTGHTFPIFFGFKGGKGSCYIIRSNTYEQLANRFNLFSFCISINDINKNGFFRILWSCCVVSSFNIIY